jgi:hypothetical protein
MNIHQLLLSLGIALSLPFAAMGKNEKNACVQEKYSFFTSGYYTYYTSEHVWNSKGERKPAHDDFTLNMGEIYLEFGLTACDTISAKFGWASIEETLNGRTHGFNDIVVGWKRQIGEFYSHLFAIELDAVIPIETEYEPGLCYGEYGAGIDFLASKGFFLCDKYCWYDLRLGYLWYSGFPSDQILADASFHFHPIEGLFLQIGGYLEYGLFNGKERMDRSLFLYNPEFRLVFGRFEATYVIGKGISIVAGYDQFIWGRNVGTGGKFYAGTQYQF